MTVPDFPWFTLVVMGCVLYVGLLFFIGSAIRDHMPPPYHSLECRIPEWHRRCDDLDCECECHNVRKAKTPRRGFP